MHAIRELRATAFARHAQLASLLLLGCVSLAYAADKAAELSDDFLEYLGSMELGEENWTDFASDGIDLHRDSAKPVAALAVRNHSTTEVAASSSSAASAISTAASTTTGKADK